MSTSLIPERRHLCAWTMRLAAAALSIAIPSSVLGDELVLRPNLTLKDKQVYLFDEDGVQLGPSTRPIPWDQVVNGKLAKDQARFDRLREKLSEPLTEIKKGLENAAYASLLQPAESLFPTFATRRSNSAYMVAQALMWARLASHRSEEAIEPYLVCLTLRLTVKDLASLPGHRRLEFDIRTGLCPDLPLVGFDRGRAKAALPLAQTRLRALGKTSPPGLRLYVAGLALAASDAASAEIELSALEAPPRPLAEIADALRAQAVLVRGQASKAVTLLERLRDASLEANRALVDYLTGNARLAAGGGKSDDGLLDLLNVSASHADHQPAIAAAALYAAQQAFGGQHDDASMQAAQIELLRSFPETDHGVRLKAELGPDSAVVKAAAEPEGTEPGAEPADPAAAGGRGPDRTRSDQRPGNRPGRPKDKGKPR